MVQGPMDGAPKNLQGGGRVAPCFVFILQPEFPIDALILASEASETQPAG